MARTALDEMKGGAFVRKDAAWRNWITPDGRFTPEAGRYHLYISYACPWANRCLAVLQMKGLQDAVGVSVVHPTWQKTKPGDDKDSHFGWVFRSPEDPPLSNANGYGSFPADGACTLDTVNGAKSARELYELAGDTEGKYSVPILWDTKEKTIVSNESSEIILMFNSAFDECGAAANASLDLYPEEMRPEIDAVNEWVYPSINNGVYRCGFATSQEAYDAAVGELFSALHRCEDLLGRHRYIAGGRMTLADVRLFVTLIRFDEVYVVYFKTNCRPIQMYPNLFNWLKDMYQSGMAESTNMAHIKTHYFTSHPKLNHYAIIPKGPGIDYSTPHDRDRAYSG